MEVNGIETLQQYFLWMLLASRILSAAGLFAIRWIVKITRA